jgi:hypothetical protein
MGNGQNEKPINAQGAGEPSGPRKKRPWNPPVLIHESLPESTFAKGHNTFADFSAVKGPTS